MKADKQSEKISKKSDADAKRIERILQGSNKRAFKKGWM